MIIIYNYRLHCAVGKKKDRERAKRSLKFQVLFSYTYTNGQHSSAQNFIWTVLPFLSYCFWNAMFARRFLCAVFIIDTTIKHWCKRSFYVERHKKRVAKDNGRQTQLNRFMRRETTMHRDRWQYVRIVFTFLFLIGLLLLPSVLLFSLHLTN